MSHHKGKIIRTKISICMADTLRGIIVLLEKFLVICRLLGKDQWVTVTIWKMSWSNNCICFICHLNFPKVSVHSEESNIAVHFVRLPLCSVYYLKLKHNYIISCFPHDPFHAQPFACSFSLSLSLPPSSLSLSLSLCYIFLNI